MSPHQRDYIDIGMTLSYVQDMQLVGGFKLNMHGYNIGTCDLIILEWHHL